MWAATALIMCVFPFFSELTKSLNIIKLNSKIIHLSLSRFAPVMVKFSPTVADHKCLSSWNRVIMFIYFILRLTIRAFPSKINFKWFFQFKKITKNQHLHYCVQFQIRSMLKAIEFQCKQVREIVFFFLSKNRRENLNMFNLKSAW